MVCLPMLTYAQKALGKYVMNLIQPLQTRGQYRPIPYKTKQL